MTVYRNSDVHRRVWAELTDPETGRTLELAPDGTVELDTDFDGRPPAHLETVTTATPPAPAAKAAKTEEK